MSQLSPGIGSGIHKTPDSKVLALGEAIIF